jgi:hypothetical protein
MERVSKKSKRRVSILNLADHINEKNVIKKILMHLNSVDWELVWAAHNKKIEYRMVRSTDFLLDCVAEGYLDILVWLRANGCEWSSKVYEYSACGGHVNILKYLTKQSKVKWDYNIGIHAARHGQLCVLIWLKENNYIHDKDSICFHLGCHDYINALEWAMKNGYPCYNIDCAFMATMGKLESLKCMINNGCSYNLDNLLDGGGKRHPHIIEYLKTLKK